MTLSPRHPQSPPEGSPSLLPTVRPRVVLLASPATYRAGAFRQAAARLDLEVIQATDTPQALAKRWGMPLAIDFTRPDATVATLAVYAAQHPVDAILALDDSATLLAARAAAALGLPHNDPDAALAARDKWVMREALRRGGIPVPEYRRYSLTSDPAKVAGEIPFPVVVKPVRLSGSRGVIRADDPGQFVRAWERARRIVLREGESLDRGELLVERYLPGVEVALEGLLTGGALRTLALFDKPDPLEGPYFEETIYVTPSRLTEATQAAVAERTAEAAAALGLREGPIHAELRINAEGIWLIEMAGRSIGGVLSTVLGVGARGNLQEIIPPPPGRRQLSRVHLRARRVAGSGGTRPAGVARPTLVSHRAGDHTRGRWMNRRGEFGAGGGLKATSTSG